MWNLENPEAVKRLHQSYIDAGADIILTNTFTANRFGLEKFGPDIDIPEINRAAALIAREAAEEDVIVFGDIGPTGKLFFGANKLDKETAEEVFYEQAKGLVEGGVDVILIETMSDLSEVRAAVNGVRKATDLPILVTMSFDTNGRTFMGVDPASAAKEMSGMDVEVIGANCGRTLSETLEAIEKMAQTVPDAVLMAKPNAGLPSQAGGDSVYDVTPDIMAEYAEKFLEAGVKIFGGCCGSNPDHIRAAAAAIKN
jgi:5-methyltetrahydrofolate--homocysteine methyltransferase